ncbi:MAG: glycine zipper 2TM domain-containing protein [Neisseria sp.]|uniref:glycine zipper 2TM domain-containing protein n=1 Tax=Neisseria sp. TaxID=192066 RepID=UPI0026DC059A|nr:glycine zipper 2TM domain-containing protein [Neisseria sp.]MDO4641887.1 glycine zipper 2TM domain-containing protein [Neisseria sp.]
MRIAVTKVIVLAATAALLSACQGLSTSQRNTAAGAVVGGVAGNLIGKDTGSTLGGAALGGVIGSQINK